MILCGLRLLASLLVCSIIDLRVIALRAIRLRLGFSESEPSMPQSPLSALTSDSCKIGLANGRLYVSCPRASGDWTFSVKELRKLECLRHAAFGRLSDKGTQNNCSPALKEPRPHPLLTPSVDADCLQ